MHICLHQDTDGLVLKYQGISSHSADYALQLRIASVFGCFVG